MITIHEEESADQGIYSEEGRTALMEDEDEITDLDEGFMRGYDKEEKVAECCQCNKILEEDVIEKEVQNELLQFCSDNCAMEYERTHQED